MEVDIKILLITALVFWPLNLSAQDAVKPCDQPQHRAFDFWVGEWSVTDTTDKKVGDSKIELVQNGCVIKESWTSATSNYTGTSYNFYNQEMARWEQLWLDNQGGYLHLKGSKEGNRMILRSADNKNDKGVGSFNQITWTANEDGSVRQFWQIFTEDEDSKVAFDGLYRPRKHEK